MENLTTYLLVFGLMTGLMADLVTTVIIIFEIHAQWSKEVPEFTVNWKQSVKSVLARSVLYTIAASILVIAPVGFFLDVGLELKLSISSFIVLVTRSIKLIFDKRSLKAGGILGVIFDLIGKIESKYSTETLSRFNKFNSSIARKYTYQEVVEIFSENFRFARPTARYARVMKAIREVRTSKAALSIICTNYDYNPIVEYFPISKHSDDQSVAS